MKPVTKLLLIVAIFGFALAACAEKPDPSTLPEVSTGYPPPEEIQSVYPAPGAYPAPVTQAPLAGESYPAPVETTQATPTPRAGLHATDPALVNLASESVQLVEFFAYW